MKRVLYISDVNSSEPIFHSQVLPHVEGLRKYCNVILLGMQRGDLYSYDYSYTSIRGDYSIQIAYANFIRQKRRLKHFFRERDIDLIYSRGFRGGLLGTLIKKEIFYNKIELVNDVRGDVLDEHRGSILKQFFFRKATKYIFENARILFFVSTFLRDKYCLEFKYTGITEICPTFVPDNKFIFDPYIRDKYRLKLGFNIQDVVLLYSGNLAVWQNIDIILEAFEQADNPNLKLLILTRDMEIHKKISSLSKSSSIVVESVSYSEIQNFYYAADFGLLVRDNIPTNICSAPTKFSEYLNSGLHIVGTRIEADYCLFLSSHKLDLYFVEDKYKLVDVFDSLTRNIERPCLKVNTLSDIVNRQIQLV